MKFGLMLSPQYPHSDDLGRRIPELVDLVQTSRDLGLDSVLTLQHYLGNLQTLQPVPLLARLIEHSGQMQLGTGILLLNLLHPVHVAEEMATLDQLCGGRFVLGVGAGYRENEFRAFGLDRSQRGARFREAVELIRLLWQGDPVHYQGKHFRLEGERIGVRPLQRPHPPIWVGANAETSVRRAARLGDAWIGPPDAKPGWLKGMLAVHQQAVGEAGRAFPAEYPLMRELYLTDDREADLRQPVAAIEAEYRAYAGYGLNWMAERFGDLRTKSFLFGTPEQVADRLADLADAGFNHFIFRVSWGNLPHAHAVRTLRLLAEAVIPRLRRKEAGGG